MDIISPAPARKVVTRAPGRTVRRINLPGMFDAPIECESSLERDFVLRAALCPSVAQLRHQPFHLSLESGRRYTPDFLATSFSGTRWVIEVKQATRVPAYRSVFDEASAVLRDRGFDFMVLTEEQIRSDRLHEQAALALRFRKAGVEVGVRDRLLDCLSRHPSGLPIDELIHRCEAHRIDVLCLIGNRVISVTAALSLAGDSLVFLHRPEVDHEVRLENWFDAPLW